MDNVQEPLKPARKVSASLVNGKLLTILGYAVAAGSLVWVFSKFSFGELSEHLRTLDWRFIALAVGFELAVYFADAWRWMILLEPAGAPTFGACLQSVFVGLFANDVLPARAGEVIRCVLLSYKTEVHLFTQSVTSTIILRSRWMDYGCGACNYLRGNYMACIRSHGSQPRNVGFWIGSGYSCRSAVVRSLSSPACP